MRHAYRKVHRFKKHLHHLWNRRSAHNRINAIRLTTSSMSIVRRRRVPTPCASETNTIPETSATRIAVAKRTGRFAFDAIMAKAALAIVLVLLVVAVAAIVFYTRNAGSHTPPIVPMKDKTVEYFADYEELPVDVHLMPTSQVTGEEGHRPYSDVASRKYALPQANASHLPKFVNLFTSAQSPPSFQPTYSGVRVLTSAVMVGSSGVFSYQASILENDVFLTNGDVAIGRGYTSCVFVTEPYIMRPYVSQVYLESVKFGESVLLDACLSNENTVEEKDVYKQLIATKQPLILPCDAFELQKHYNLPAILEAGNNVIIKPTFSSSDFTYARQVNRMLPSTIFLEKDATHKGRSVQAVLSLLLEYGFTPDRISFVLQDRDTFNVAQDQTDVTYGAPCVYPEKDFALPWQLALKPPQSGTKSVVNDPSSYYSIYTPLMEEKGITFHVAGVNDTQTLYLIHDVRVQTMDDGNKSLTLSDLNWTLQEGVDVDYNIGKYVSLFHGEGAKFVLCEFFDSTLPYEFRIGVVQNQKNCIIIMILSGFRQDPMLTVVVWTDDSFTPSPLPKPYAYTDPVIANSFVRQYSGPQINEKQQLVVDVKTTRVGTSNAWQLHNFTVFDAIPELSDFKFDIPENMAQNKSAAVLTVNGRQYKPF